MWPSCERSSVILLRAKKEVEDPGATGARTLTFPRKDSTLNSWIIKAKQKLFIVDLNNLSLLKTFFFFLSFSVYCLRDAYKGSAS